MVWFAISSKFPSLATGFRTAIMGNPHIVPEKHVEKYADEIEATEKAGVDFSKRDYTGAVAKTDPAEIKLVRKLDYRIMVSSHGCPAAA